MTAPIVCPECGGPYLEGHPAGMVFRHAQSCSLLAAEDARQVADVGMALQYGWPGKRPTTPVERQLLDVIGLEIPDDAPCVVSMVSNSVRRRFWPDATPKESTP